ncbi:MAG: flagellar filament capping protein FliD [Acidobacteriota bacterium]|nr:flagellar filament capping protein FliD [Acidobacteriota bacterium]
MGTVGINFGSATSGGGFDVTATVASIVSNLQAVETPWKNQLSSLKAQDTAFTSLGTDLSTLSTSLQALTDFQGVMASKLGSSSDTNILSLGSASATAVAGSHTVVVTQLAQTSSEYSSVVPVGDKLAGGLTFQVGITGKPQTVAVVIGSSDTLSTYAAAINSADVGVTARIITDAKGSRLSLVSGTDGAAGQITITGSLTDTTASLAIAMKSGLAGQDAMLSVDGISVDSGSNTISGAIPGVTFQLISADPTINVQVQIVNDNVSVKSAFSTLVTAYNAVVKDLATQEGTDSSGNSEPLRGSSVLSRIQSSLSLALSSGVASGSVNSLYQMGISVSQDGTLKLDTAALDSELNSNYSGVVGYFQNAKSFGLNFQNALDQVGNQSPSGAITLALAANSSQETTFNADITAEDALIATQKTSLTAQLNLANEILQAIPQQLNEVNQLYSAMTGYNTKTG